MTQPLKLPAGVSVGVREILEGMLAISEGRRLNFDEVDKLLILQ